jgi:two-component system, OmpR family, sensor kinase
VGQVTLRVRLLLALAYVLVLAVVALEVPLALSLRDRVDAEVRSQARSQADIVAATVSGRLTANRAAELAEVVAAAARSVRGRVVVTGPDGALLADSAGTDRLGTDYGTRPEIAAALRGDPFQEQRRSETLDQEILATAVPIVERGRTVGAVRVTQSVDAVSRATRRAIVGLAAIGLLVLGLGLAAGVIIARQIAGPMRRLEDAARQVAEGDLTARAKVEGSAEQRTLARTFNEMTARVERLVAGQRDFVADASHQLRTPLTGLRLRIEEARATADAGERERHLDAGLDELDRMSATIDDLLLLSRTGEREGEGEAIDLADAAADARRRWERTAAARDIALTAQHDGAASVWASRADLDRAVDAVVENAIHYTPPGGHVTVVARGAAIDVLDDGPGLAPGEEDDVFARFHRGRAGRGGAPGTGLGLPIARELMRAWGGDAMLANRPEGGARATLTAPAADEFAPPGRS